MAAKVKYRRLGSSRLPWSTEHPLVFHDLTSLHCRNCRERRMTPYAVLTKLLLENAVLSPASKRRATKEKFWGGDEEATMSLNTDEFSGDVDWLFFTPLRKYDGMDVDKPLAGSAVLAFDFDEWASRGQIGWRPLDLISPFKLTQEYVGWKYRRKPNSREMLAKHLRQMADCYTITDRDLVRKLVHLEAEHLSGSPDAQREAEALMAERSAECARTLHWLPKDEEDAYRMFKESKRNYPTETGIALDMAFYTGDIGAGLGVNLAQDATPELLLNDEIPLRSARWYTNARGVWEEMPRRW